MKHFLLCLVLASASRFAFAGGVEDGVLEAMGIVQQKNLKIDDDAARKAVVLAIARTADPGAELLSDSMAQNRRDELAGRCFSAGFRLTISNGLPQVVDTTADGPAARAGLAKGDVISQIGTSNQFDLINLPDALRATRGHAADKIELQIRHAGSATNSAATLTLAQLNLPAIECAETLPNGIFYIKLNGLFANGGAALADALNGWSAKNHGGVILDLRGASGDDLESAKTVASLFAKENDPLFSIRDRGDKELQTCTATAGKPLGIPVLVLIDRDTRGASELLAAVMAGSVKGAMLVGRSSRGDPLAREQVKLASGDFLYIATRQIVTSDGTRYDGRTGVKPDVQAGGGGQIEYDAQPVADRRQLLDQELQDFALRNRIRGDSALRRAVDILLGLKALNIGAGGSAKPSS